MKMFGQLTRTKHIWIPDPLLCKRFNVMNPFPGQKAIDAAKGLVERENQLEQELKSLNDRKYVEQQPIHQTMGKLAFEREQEATVSADNPPMAISSHDNKDEGPAMDYERASMDLFRAIFEEEDVQQDLQLQIEAEGHVSSVHQLPETMAGDSESYLTASSEISHSRKMKGPTFPQFSDTEILGHNIDAPAIDRITDITIIGNQKIQTEDFEEKRALTGSSQQHPKRHERRRHGSKHGRKEGSRTHRSRERRSRGESFSPNSTGSEEVVIWTEKKAV
jgi:G patch domain-containing protein 1